MVQGDASMPERGISPAGEPSVSHLVEMASRAQQQTARELFLATAEGVAMLEERAAVKAAELVAARDVSEGKQGGSGSAGHLITSVMAVAKAFAKSLASTAPRRASAGPGCGRR